MTKPTKLPLELQGVPFDVAQAKMRGLSPERLRRHDLRRPFHGIRVAHAPSVAVQEFAQSADSSDPYWRRLRAESEQRAHEYAVRMPSGQFFSHVTAALLHGLPVPRRLLEQTDVHVGTSTRTLRRKGRGVRGHLILSGLERVTHVAGLPVASAVDVWTQLSTTLTLDELVMIGDALVCRQAPLATLPELADAVARHAGHPGAQRLREAFSLVRPRTDSARETQLRLLIVRAGLPEPEVNPALTNRFGEFLAYGDLAYRRFKILIEYDGGQHRDDEAQYHHDIDRLEALMAEGWRVIKVNKTHLGQAAHATGARIRRALLDAGWRPDVS